MKMQSDTASLKNTPEAQLSAAKDMKARKSWNHDIRGVKHKIERLIKSVQLIEESLAELKKRFKKGKRSSSLQPDSEQKVDKAHVQMLSQEVNPPADGHDLTSAQPSEQSEKVQTELGPMKPTGASDEGPSCLSVQQQLVARSLNPGLEYKAQTPSAMTSASASHGAPFPAMMFGSALPEHAIGKPGKLPSKQQSSDEMHRHSLEGNKNSNFSYTAVVKPTPQLKRSRSDTSPPRKAKRPTQSLISNAFEKLQNSCCDVMPTLREHLEGTAEVPVLSDVEASVIADFSANQSLVEMFMSTILLKVKTERAAMKLELLQSFCRVYVALCQHTGDSYKAHALAYRLLKEDFPEASKLILFMVSAWPSVWLHDSPLCQAIHIVSRLKAEGEILDYLSKCLHWDERPPGDILKTIGSILKALIEDSSLTFNKNKWYGNDLCQAGWEYIFSLHLLCAQLDCTWTYTNIIGMEFLPILNTWLTQPRAQQTPIRDVCIAAVLRLLGRLGQLGHMKNLAILVQNMAKGINMFGKHGVSDGVSWEVQLSLVYTIHDLAPSNAKEALKGLSSWHRKTTQLVPPAVTSCMRQISSLCHKPKP